MLYPSFARTSSLALTLCIAGLASALPACSNSSGGSTPDAATQTDDGTGNDDSGAAQGTDDSGTAHGADDSGTATGPHDAGVAKDAGHSGDAAATGGDAGPRDIGSCCATQTTPGCSNPDLEICVCQKDSTCCTQAWGPQCVAIVTARYCQPGVRECVCGTDAGQWMQTQCCDKNWDPMTCDAYGTGKCGEVTGCF